MSTDEKRSTERTAGGALRPAPTRPAELDSLALGNDEGSPAQRTSPDAERCMVSDTPKTTDCACVALDAYECWQWRYRLGERDLPTRMRRSWLERLSTAYCNYRRWGFPRRRAWIAAKRATR
jgi:hypothetical protein